MLQRLGQPASAVNGRCARLGWRERVCPGGLRALSLAEMVRREMLPLQRSSARAPHVQNRRFVSRSRRLGSRPGVQRGRSPFCREYEGVPHNYYYSFSWGGETPITQPPSPRPTAGAAQSPAAHPPTKTTCSFAMAPPPTQGPKAGRIWPVPRQTTHSLSEHPSTHRLQ